MTLSYAELVSTIALAAAVLGLWLHWQRHRREKEDRQPEVLFRTSPALGLARWNLLKITVRNRADLSITADKISVVWPPWCRLGKPVKVPSGQPWRGDAPYAEPSRRVRSYPLGLEMRHAGYETKPSLSGITFPGTRDTHSDWLLVSGRPNSSVRLRISFSASRKSQRLRSSIIKVTIVAVAQTNSAQDAAM
jgi:hypothetical protein